jgi:hypothetical protein
MGDCNAEFQAGLCKIEHPFAKHYGGWGSGARRLPSCWRRRRVCRLRGVGKPPRSEIASSPARVGAAWVISGRGQARDVFVGFVDERLQPDRSCGHVHAPQFFAVVEPFLQRRTRPGRIDERRCGWIGCHGRLFWPFPCRTQALRYRLVLAAVGGSRLAMAVREAERAGGDDRAAISRAPYKCVNGSLEWYVLNGHTRRRVSKSFPTRAKAEAKRASLQTKLDVAKALRGLADAAHHAPDARRGAGGPAGGGGGLGQ